MLITVSGLDGAGKSTLIGGLRAALERHGHAVAVLHMNDDVGVYAYARRARDGVLRLLGGEGRRPRPAPLGSPPVPRSGAGGRGLRGLRDTLRRVRYALVWSTTVRWCVYPIDLLIFALHRLYVEKLTKRVLVMDRYFYDTLVDLRARGRRRGIRVLERLTPTPDVPVLLDVPPEQAFARKTEFSIDYLRRRWAAYQTVLSWVPSCVTLPNADVRQAQRGLWRVVTARMPGPLGRRRRWLAGLDRANGGGRGL